MKLRIAHMYPDLLDLYSDRGNVIVLQKRAQWRGLDVTVDKITLGEMPDLKDYDLIVMGGGMDREQIILAEDLGRRRDQLDDAIQEGTVILGICAGYQMLGHYYQTHTGTRVPGLELIDIVTIGDNNRVVGNVVCEMEIEGEKTLLIGYENRSGRTELGPQAEPLARVLRSVAYTQKDNALEGVRQGNIFGTYLHGPLLAKSPEFADYLLRLALRRHDAERLLTPLDNSLESRTQQKLVRKWVGA